MTFSKRNISPSSSGLFGSRWRPWKNAVMWKPHLFTYWYGFVASLVVLDAKAMFGTVLLQNLFLPGSSGDKTAYDKHHLFPKDYLEYIGIADDRDRNQFANFAYIDYDTNIRIGNKPPSEYVSSKRDSLGEEEYVRMCESHALPLDWEKMEFFDFLAARRKLMAPKVREAFEKLGMLKN